MCKNTQVKIRGKRVGLGKDEYLVQQALEASAGSNVAVGTKVIPEYSSQRQPGVLVAFIPLEFNCESERARRGSRYQVIYQTCSLVRARLDGSIVAKLKLEFVERYECRLFIDIETCMITPDLAKPPGSLDFPTTKQPSQFRAFYTTHFAGIMLQSPRPGIRERREWRVEC